MEISSQELQHYMKEYLVPARVKKRKHPRMKNGFGSVVTLKGNRSKPFMARPPVKEWDDNGYPIYEKPIGYYADWMEAFIALVKYNEKPYSTTNRSATFEEIWKKWYIKRFGVEYVNKPDYRPKSTEQCYRAAYLKCEPLYKRIFADLRTDDMQTILDTPGYSHATLEHVKLVLRAVSKHALEYDVIEKDYTQFLKINKEDDDEHGVPFTKKELGLLWKSKDKPFVDTVLIYIYSGWRINELSKMPLSDIDLEKRTFKGGSKTRAGKNRVVPIHSKIYDMVRRRYDADLGGIIFHNFEEAIQLFSYRECFDKALISAGIKTKHTPHDCRHTFASLLNSAGANESAIKALLGHAGKDITERIYTHKELSELRETIELI
ncbi:MAG: tyrosine-type recombinase/integrase [Lachnospiraceae bacterium]